MAHVQITYDKDRATLVVDGVDISDSVLADGFDVTLPGAPPARAVVTMKVIADHLDLDLPDAVVAAFRSAEGADQ